MFQTTNQMGINQGKANSKLSRLGKKKASWGWTCCEQIFHKGPFIFKETKYIIQYISIIHQYSAVASIFSIKECLSIDQSVYPSIHLHYSHT